MFLKSPKTGCNWRSNRTCSPASLHENVCAYCHSLNTITPIVCINSYHILILNLHSVLFFSQTDQPSWKQMRKEFSKCQVHTVYTIVGLWGFPFRRSAKRSFSQMSQKILIVDKKPINSVISSHEQCKTCTSRQKTVRNLLSVDYTCSNNKPLKSNIRQYMFHYEKFLFKTMFFLIL